MRVLHVSTGRTWRGGEQQTLLLMRGLARRGVAQGLFCRPHSALASRARAAGLDVETAPILGEADLGALGRLLRRVRAGRPDVLHLHTSQAHGLGAAAARLAGRRRPAVVVTRRVEHSIFRHSFLGLDRWKYVPGADRVLCVSDRVRRVLVADGIAEARLDVVPDGVQIARFARPLRPSPIVRAELGIAPTARVVGAVGHLDASKGQADLLEAVAALGPEAEDHVVLLVGGGKERSRLLERAAALGLGRRLVATGFRDDVPDLLHAMDMFVHASRSEGLGGVVLEAMAAGRPIVAAAAGGVPEALDGGRCGRLVPPGEPAVLAVAIREVLAGGAEVTARTEAARAYVRRRFTDAAMIDGTIAAYERALEALPAAEPGR